MSINFPTAGSTAALHRATADLTTPSAWTFYYWYRRAAAASIDTAGCFGIAGDPEIDLFWRSAAINDFQIERYTSGTRGGWRVTAANLGPLPSATAWRFMAITQSGISAPLFYHSDPAVSSGPVSRTVTEISTPSGSATTVTSRRPVYANSWFSSTFDSALNGDMACAGWHNVVLTEGELHEAMWRGITFRGLIDHRYMWNLTQGKADSSGTADAGTTSGSVAAKIDGPPVRPVIVLNRSGAAATVAGAITVVGGIASETDSSLAGAAAKMAAGGLASETDTPLAATAAKLVAGGLPSEADTALAGSVIHPITVTGGIAAESDTGIAGQGRKAVAGGLASETDTALTGAAAKAAAGGLAAETDSALQGSVIHPIVVAGGIAVETDTALAGAVVGAAPPPARPVVESRRPLLAIRLRGPGREWTVLGSDDARGIVAEGFTASADRSGPTTCAFSLRRDPALAQPDLAAFSDLDAEVAGQLVWGGRVWETPGSRAAERSLSVSGRGWQGALEDDVYRRAYVHQRLADWRDQKSFLTYDTTLYKQSGRVDNDRGAIVIGWDNGAVLSGATRVGIVLDLGAADAKRVVMTWASSNNAATISAVCIGADKETSSGLLFGEFETVFSFALNVGATGESAGTITTRRRYVHVYLDVNFTGTIGADHWLHISALRVFRETAYEQFGQSILKASDVVKDSRSTSALLAASNARITSSTFSIPHLDTGRGFQPPRAVMDAANVYHGWNLGVDARRRVIFGPRPASPVVEVGEWSGAEFSDQSIATSEALYNRVIVEGSTAAGERLSVIRTAAVPSLAALAITRTMVLQVSAVLTTASAEVIGDAWLAERARSQFRGALRIVGMGSVREITTGRPLHPSELLGLTGQMIRLSHLIDPETGDQGRDGVIDSVTYDHDSDSASVAIDNDSGRFGALLERVGALQSAGR